MSAAFDFYFDLGSPYSYLASTQLAGLEERTGATARIVPVTLGGIRKAVGRDIPPMQQLRYMANDVRRWAAQYGVPWTLPAAFPANGITALRTVVAAELDGRGRDAMHAIFRMYWAKGEDISDAKVVERALTGAGLHGMKLVARAAEQEIKDGLRRNTDAALERGVFGVPMFAVGEELFWGNDRLTFLEAALDGQKKA